MKRDCYESPSCLVERVCLETGFAASPQQQFDLKQGDPDYEFA